ncbi:MAG: hypothetical protein CMJ52_10380 [Planctomycetaceae bacterium]|nr:hypothetical protein [Planctomycetaceae bacterium]
MSVTGFPGCMQTTLVRAFGTGESWERRVADVDMKCIAAVAWDDAVFVVFFAAPLSAQAFPE